MRKVFLLTSQKWQLLPFFQAKWVFIRFYVCVCVRMNKGRKAFIHAVSRGFREMGWLGLEPRTNALKGHCSTS
jgi:hypothetical protein